MKKFNRVPGLFLFAALSFLPQTLLAQAPNLKAVWPRYGANQMELTWDPVPLAAEYAVRRKVNSGAYSDWVSAGAVTNWVHPDAINAADTFTYQVRSRTDTVWSGPSNARSNRMVKLWPVSKNASCDSEGVDILNGFNQPIQVGAFAYLHEGMDIHGAENFQSECVRAPLGGVVFDFGASANPGEFFINIAIFMNNRVERIQFNHIQSIPASIAIGVSVQPGEQLGVINSTIWVTEASHTHCHYWLDNANFFATTMDPHLIWDASAHRDPQNLAPKVEDCNGDMKALRYRKGPDLVDYFPDETAVYRETDIVVETFDKQSVDAPWAAPRRIGYYVEKRDGNAWIAAVKSTAAPYTLIDNAKGFFQATSSAPNLNTTNALSDRALALQSAPPATPNFYTAWPGGAGWNQWWTYIPTNTWDTSGTLATLDRNQCWATDARDTVTTDNGYRTNYVRARCIEEAKFPDGRHRVSIRVQDYANTAPDYRKEVIVDNFAPYVKKVTMQAGQLSYAAEWKWEGGSLVFQPNTDMDKACGEVAIRVFTSEPMKNVSLNVPTLGFSQNLTIAVAGTNSKEWAFTIPASNTENKPMGPHVLHINGQDLNDNAMQGFANENALPGANIPKHQHDGTWAPVLVSQADIVHKFSLDSFSMTVTLDSFSNVCENDKDGLIIVSVAGGMAPYEFSINNGASWQSSNKFFDLATGKHKVQVRDKMHCVVSKETEINAFAKIRIGIAGGGYIPFCLPGTPPAITLTASASGGFPPYTYSWPGGSLTVSGSGPYTCVATDGVGCTGSATTYVAYIPIVCSRDPNDMIGPEGYGEPKWVSVKDNLPYTIRFENDPDFATAPAQRVEIRHVLDSDLNLFSLRLGDFGFGNMTFTVPPNATFYNKRLDVQDSLGILVDVSAGIDVSANQVFWIFQAVDPLTGLAPSDPQLGLLPVNDTITRRGEGFVNFSVRPKNSSMTGDTIHAEAAIIFDDNETIHTPAIFNVIDALPPASAITSNLPGTTDSTSFTLTWTAQDDPGGCGLRDYALYVSTNDGIFLPHQTGIPDTFTVFSGLPGNTYSFFTVASDNVGNTEALKAMGEDTVAINDLRRLTIFSISQDSFCAGNDLFVQWSSTGIMGLDIAFSPDGGMTWQPLASGVKADTSIFQWAIPADFAGCANCAVLVADTATGSLLRDTAFTRIHASPQIASPPDVTNVTCPGDLDGAIALNVSGGLPPYQYLWSDEQTTATAIELATGPYTATVTDANGCSSTASATVGVGNGNDVFAQAQVRAFLQGPYVAAANLMHDSLRVLDLIPLAEPYTGLSTFSHTGGGGGEQTTTTVLAVAGPDAIVDWVFLELRSSANPALVLATRSALLQRDGDVVDVDGTSPVVFGIASGPDYYVVVRHRNHFGVQLGAATPYPACESVATDFTVLPPEGFYAHNGLSDAQKTISGTYALWAGNGRIDTQLKYNGSNNDRNAILMVVGLTTPNAIVPGYRLADYNLDGVVKYNGTANDRNVLLGNVGITTPSAVVEEQVAR